MGMLRDPPPPPPPPPSPSISIRDLNAGSSEPPKDMRIFALLIGINYVDSKIPDIRPLRGAVADALEVNHYLQNRLGVPSNQITVLIEEKATRFAIIEALTNLIIDDDIRMGDAILIYYAGQSGLISLQPEMPAIYPYDIADESNTVIPYFVLEILLARIACHKGNNITVIFDCSHSGPGDTFSGFDGGYGAHIVDVPSCEDEITPKEAYFLRTAQGSTSHVLLAACGPTQIARESAGHGVFTDSLLKLLKEIPPHKLRYSDIIPSLKVSPQDPQCEGLYRNRILFTSTVPQHIQFFMMQDAKNSSGQYYVYAGTQHNVTLNTKFHIYRESDLSLTQKIGVLHVVGLYAFFTTAKLLGRTPDLDLDVPITAIAMVDKKPEEKIPYLKIHIPLNNNFLRVYRTMEDTIYNLDDICVRQDEVQGSHAIFFFTDKEEVMTTIRTATHHEFNQIIKDFEILPRFLSRMAHFYRELNLFTDIFADTADNDSRRLHHGNIEVEFYQLLEVSVVAESTGFLDEKLEPMDRNLYIDGKINLIVADEYGYPIPYGLRLVNRSDQNLHLQLFHFTNSDLSISPYIEEQDRSIPIAIQQRSDLTIGYGPKGYSPICFEIAEGYDIDVGYLKIYLSTERVNLNHLEQLSPFTETETSVIGHYIPTADPWIEIVIPIIQTRH